jgi:hypothetical protein
MSHIITYIKKASLAKSVFGVALFLCGIILIGFGYLIPGLFWAAVGLSVLTAKGAQLDITNKKYREIKSVAGVHFGTWKPFPEFEYVSVFKTSEKKSVTIVTATATKSEGVIVLNLFYKGNKHFTIYKTDDKADAFKMAEKLRKLFDIDVLDATEKEKKWVEAV